MENQQVHDLAQGTTAWHQHRNNHFNASEAPAMMGDSPYVKREELLTEKKTGVARAISDELQRVFDRGHQVEGPTRAMLEEDLGEELYPETVSAELPAQDVPGGILKLSASLDGVTLDDETIVEIKQWNQKDAEIYSKPKAKLLPKHYWQVEQQLAVKGAKRCIFCMSDGTRDKYIKIEYTPVRGRLKKLLSGWGQFAIDLENYEPPELAEVKVVPYEPPALPALKISISQEILDQNVEAFAMRATEFLESINTDLQTDQDFADAEANVKACKRAEEAIAAAREQVLHGSADITALMNMISNLEGKIRSTRLALDKAVKSEKEARKHEIIVEYQRLFDAATDSLETELHGFRLDIDPRLSEAAKGLRTLSSIEQKVRQAYDDAMECADALAAEVKANWDAIPENCQHLFRDFGRIGDMEASGFSAIVNERIREENERNEARKSAEKAQEAAQASQDAEISVSGTTDTPETRRTQNTAPQGGFDNWWGEVGSRFAQAPGEDDQEYMRRVARAAWRAAAEEKIQWN